MTVLRTTELRLRHRRHRGGGGKGKELAGDKDVAVNGGQMARQCLEAGLLDEVGVELVPVVLGGGTPLFAELSVTPVQFEGPVAVVEGTGVTHLRYRVKK